LDFFTDLLKFIKNRNLKVTSINNWQKNNIGDIVLTFDDGFSSDFELVYPLLKQMNITATFFIVSDFVGNKGYMTWENIKQLSDSGMEIASHSVTHKYLNALNDKKIFFELNNSKIKIEQMIGKEVSSFAYPFGSCSRKTHKFAAEAGYKNICNSKPGLCRFNSTILSRNSIHSNLNSSNIDRLVFPNQFELTIQKFGYLVRNGLKQTLGVKNYIKLRESIY
jgi:peptidoglycan/xylan/chitin deacetylase (PgdA/CDA1 family)